jgi:hypothetical protein
MRAGSLRENEKTSEYKGCENRRRKRPLKARPPWSLGLSRKSPTVAPSGRVRMNAAENNVTREMSVQK